MVVLMNKILVFLFSTIIYINASDNYTFLVNKYNKEIELEAKIVSNIAQDLKFGNRTNLFIPNVTDNEKKIYSEYFNLTNECSEANFVFIKNDKNTSSCQKSSGKIFFTNNYDLLLKDEQFIGAFFWSKSRPNIVFVKNRSIKNNIQLPESYDKFIEEF